VRFEVQVTIYGEEYCLLGEKLCIQVVAAILKEPVGSVVRIVYFKLS
jgi:hypothetical protein